MSDDRKPTFLGFPTSRRAILRTSVFAGGVALIGCSANSERTTQEAGSVLAPQREPTPPDDLGPEEFLFLTPEEGATLTAIVARIIPGDDADPGAVQAGVQVYIDRKLDGFEAFPEPTYRQGPFAEGYEEGEAPPAGPDTVPVAQSELNRYGFQSQATPQELYRTGLAGVDRLAQTRYGSLFADLDEGQQDELLIVLDSVQQISQGNAEEGSSDEQDVDTGVPSAAEVDQAVELFGEADPGSFFDTVRVDTIEGMFSDPAYGGNRNLVGWTLIGWPGAQRSYSQREMLHGTNKQPTSMEGLTPMNPDRLGGGREAIEKPRDGVHNH